MGLSNMIKSDATGKRRIDWIDLVKGLCMIAIIQCHIYTNSFYSNLLYVWELTGFFIVAGYTFKIDKSFKSFFKKKFCALVIPVFSFGIINLILASIFKHISIIKRLRGIIFQIPGNDDDMWFVACLFVMELLYYFISKICAKEFIKSLFCFCFLICGLYIKEKYGRPVPWHLINAFLLILYIHIGFYLKKYRMVEKYENLNGNYRLWLNISLVALFITISFGLNNSFLDIHLLNYGSIWKFYLVSFVGSMAIILSAINIQRYNTDIVKAIKYIGKNSLAFYGLQSKAITTCLSLVAFFNLLRYISYVSPFVCVITLVLLTPFVYIISHYFPFILGKFN